MFATQRGCSVNTLRNSTLALNTGRITGSDQSATSIDPSVLFTAMSDGNRHTKRAAWRNLKRLMKQEAVKAHRKADSAGAPP